MKCWCERISAGVARAETDDHRPLRRRQPFAYQSPSQIIDDEGVSIAPTVAIAYMLHRGWSLKNALVHVQRIYPRLFPNAAFFKQLLEREKDLQGKNSMSEGAYPDVFEQPGMAASMA